MRRQLLTGALFTALLISAPAMALAAPITFFASGQPNVAGFVQFDDADFDGTAEQFILNTEILDLQLVVFGQTFTLADVDLTASTLITSTGPTPFIFNGAGNLADNGTLAIAFFPDGYGSTAFDGDASLSTGPSGAGLAQENFYAVKWGAQPAAVPEPASLLLLGTAGVGLLARMRKSQKA